MKTRFNSLFLMTIVSLFLVYSCNMNSRFTNPSEYVRYASQVNGGGSGNSGGGSKIEYKTLTVNIDGNGYVIVDSADRYVSSLKIALNTKVNLEAMATGGEEFQKWSGSIQSTDKVIEFTMSKNITLLASFAVPTVYKKLYLTIGENGGVFINGELTQNNENNDITIEKEYAEGTKITLKAQANDTAILFKGWSGSIDNLDSGTSDTAEISFTLNDDMVFSASFNDEKKLTINNPNFDIGYIEVSKNGSAYVKYQEAKSTIDVSVNDVLVIEAKAVNQITHYFAGWTGSSTDISAKITITVNGDLILNSTFKQVMRTLVININDATRGNVKVNNETYTKPVEVPIFTAVTITATRTTGYAFEKYSGDLTSTAREVTLDMDVNKTIIASFVEPLSKYNDPDMNGFNPSKFIDDWTIEASFDNKEVPTYKFLRNNGGVWNVNAPGYVTSKANNTEAQGSPVSSVKYYQYRSLNFYNRSYDYGNITNRFLFYRFTGRAIVISLDNALCAVDTYTKLLFGYAVPGDFSRLGVPGEWYSVESKAVNGLKFYENDPIGFVKGDGNVVLFESFKQIQRNAAGKKDTSKYLPKATPTAELKLDITDLDENSVIRSPYY